MSAEGKRYRDKLDEAADALTEALCETYKRVTGRNPSDRLRDKLWETVRYEML